MSEVLAPFDVAVIGGGPAGVAAAIALAQRGANTALIARRVPYADSRAARIRPPRCKRCALSTIPAG
jgi:2-octaprenyl-6-methoxyphenol hydroxylase